MSRHVCLCVLVACLLLTGCGFQISSGSTEAQIKALSEVLQKTEVETCSKVTATFPPYVQVTSIWAGRVAMSECLKALYPY